MAWLKANWKQVALTVLSIAWLASFEYMPERRHMLEMMGGVLALAGLHLPAVRYRLGLGKEDGDAQK